MTLKIHKSKYKKNSGWAPWMWGRRQWRNQWIWTPSHNPTPRQNPRTSKKQPEVKDEPKTAQQPHGKPKRTLTCGINVCLCKSKSEFLYWAAMDSQLYMLIIYRFFILSSLYRGRIDFNNGQYLLHWRDGFTDTFLVRDGLVIHLLGYISDERMAVHCLR